MPDGGTRRRTPLFEAQHSGRYERQRLMLDYESTYDCHLIVLIGPIFDESVTFFEEVLLDSEASKDLHLMLVSPGGYGDAAIRLVRGAQARCRELVIHVPDQAKSAATLLCLGAHRIVMGPMSDLGPIDPQFPTADGRGLVAAKDIIAAYERSLRDVEDRPDTYPVVAAMLANAGVDSLQVEAAQMALARTTLQMREALASHPGRSPEEVDALAQSLAPPLIEQATRHEALFSAADARGCGLPIEDADLGGDQWQRIWQLWAKYFELGADNVFEGPYASQVIVNR